MLRSITSTLESAVCKAQNRALALLHREEREEGQGMVEYALILVLIAIVVIVVLAVVGHRVSDVFNNIQSGLS